MAQTKVDLMAYGIDSVSAEKILKKMLTSVELHDRLIELPLRTAAKHKT